MPKPPSPSAPAADGPQRRPRRSPNEVRTLLLEAARFEFERAGFAGATTAAIATRAQATEAQLFRYYGSKAELFAAAVLDRLNAAFAGFNAARLDVTATADDWEGQGRRYIAELSGFIRGHEHLLMSLIVAQAYGGGSVDGVGKVGGLREYFEISADKMRAHADGEPRVEPSLMVRVSFGAVLASVLFRDWLFTDTGASEAEITAALTDFIHGGVRVNHAAPEPPPSSRRAPRAGRRADRPRRTR